MGLKKTCTQYIHNSRIHLWDYGVQSKVSCNRKTWSLVPKPHQHALCATYTSTKTERERERASEGGGRERETCIERRNSSVKHEKHSQVHWVKHSSAVLKPSYSFFFSFYFLCCQLSDFFFKDRLFRRSSWQPLTPGQWNYHWCLHR